MKKVLFSIFGTGLLSLFILFGGLVSAIAPTGETLTVNTASPTNNATISITFGATNLTSGAFPQYNIDRGSGVYDGFIAWPVGTDSHTMNITLNGGEGLNTLRVQFQNADGGPGGTATDTITLDTVNPTVNITAPAATTSTDGTQTFTFTDNDVTSGVATRTGSADGAPFVAITTGSAFNALGGWGGLVEGAFTMSIRVTDNAGNPTTTTRVFDKDTTGPTGSVANGSGDPTNDDTPTLNLTIADAGVGVVGAQMRFSCNDSSWTAFEAYASPKINFDINSGANGCAAADGAHTVYVQFQDSLGNIGISYNTGAFALDTTGPTGTIANGSGDPTNDDTPTLNLTVSEGGTQMSFSCDDAAWSGWEAYATPKINFDINSGANGCGAADGARTVYIRFQDALLNISASSNTGSFVLDTTGPIVTITSPAINTETNGTQAFTYTAVDAIDGTLTEEAEIGGAAFVATSTGSTLGTVSGWGGAAEGVFTLTVQATDDAGNVTTDTRNFVKDTVNPTISENVAIFTPTSDNTPSFTLNAVEDTNLVYANCGSATGSVTSGNTVITLNALVDGTYNNCQITPTDDAGNTGTMLTLSSFTIDTANPVISEVVAVSTPTNDNTPSFTLNATEAVTLVYANCGSATASVTSGNTVITLNALADGTVNNCQITPTDLSLNPGAMITLSSFVIDTTAPLANITAPVAATATSGAETFTFTDSDATSGVGTREGSADNVTFSAITTGGAFSTLGGFAGVTDGVFTMTLRVTDNAGNVTTTTRAFVKDTTGPTGSIANGSLDPTNDDTPTLNMTIADAGVGTAGALMRFSCNNVAWTAFEAYATPKTDFDINSGTNGCTTADGPHTVYVQFQDSLGNTGTSYNTGSFFLDMTGPVFSNIGVVSNNPYDASYAKADSILTFTMSLASSDSYAGGGSITFTIGGGAPQVINFIEAAGATRLNTYTATFDLSTYGGAINNAAINVTNITMNDFLAHPMTGFVAGTPTPTVIVDTLAPSLSGATVSTNGTSGLWARNNQFVIYNLSFDEAIIRSSLGSASTAANISTLFMEFDLASFGTSDFILFRAVTGDNGTVTMTNANFSIVDRAGNTTAMNAAAINGFAGALVQTDTTRPTVSAVTIFSDNALDTTLAKTNDTITVQFTTADNLSPTIALNPGQTILSSAATDGASGAVGAGKTIFRFTDGTETSEVVVPFSFSIQDLAGNNSSPITTSTNDGSTVRFDRTNPVVQNVAITATSQDGAAYLGDVPTYYARQGDTIDFQFETCDWVGVGVPAAPTGTFFGAPLAMVTAGPTSGNCTTATGGDGLWRLWTAQLNGIDGPEGTVTFDIVVQDNAGNGDGATNPEVHVTGTTNGSSVIFDKTIPVNPTDTVDMQGNESPNFKGRGSAQFTWNNDVDPNLSGADQVSDVWKYWLQFTNPANGGEIHRGPATTVVEEVLAWGAGAKSWDGQISALGIWSGQPIPPRNLPSIADPSDQPYQLRMMTIDKAGNTSYGAHAAPNFGTDANLGDDDRRVFTDTTPVVYQQYYTVDIHGWVRGATGGPMIGASIQVVARYNELCDAGKTICTDVADSNGFYSIVVNREKDYNVTYYKPGFYMAKHEQGIYRNSLLLYEDVEISPTLQVLNNGKEWQTRSQIIQIQTNVEFGISPNLNWTDIYVTSLSGEITAKNVLGGIHITSLSEITLIESNNPAVVIVDNGDNTFLVKNAGTINLTSSLTDWGEMTSPDGTVAFGTTPRYNSGDARIGVVVNVGPGNSYKTMSGTVRHEGTPMGGAFWTEAQSKVDLERINKGTRPEVLTYINRNGYKVFKGYRSGTLPLSKYKRAQNEIRFHGDRIIPQNIAPRHFVDVVPVGGGTKERIFTPDIKKPAEKVFFEESLSSRYQTMKSRYQRTAQKKDKPMRQFYSFKTRRVVGTDDALSEQARRITQANKVNKFERKSSFAPRPESIIKGKDQNYVKMRVGGKSFSMAQYSKNTRRVRTMPRRRAT